MNESRPIDENEFAQRLEQAEMASKSDGTAKVESAEIENPNQKEKFEAAARVLGMIHRIRKSKDKARDETAANKLDTPTFVEAQKVFVIEGGDHEAISKSGAGPQKIGRFEIQRQLGQGGYGLVFLARDPQLDRFVALKVPRAEAFMDSSTRERFIREAKSAGGLNHANIVPVFEAGQVGPVCYIASAYCDGPSLGKWVLNRKQPISPMVAADLLMTLADAVQHAHSRGIIHRDLKPENILVEIDSEADHLGDVNEASPAPLLRITDFGLAKDLDDRSNLTQTGSVLGTPSFMSPEQTDSTFGEPTNVVDIYGLGAILYYMLCKIPPISGDSLLDTIKNVKEQNPVSPRQLRPEIPRDLESICLKCLEKQTRHRYQTASELQSDLLRFRNGLPVLARRPSSLDRALMWCRRRPAVTGLAVSLLVVLAASSIALGILLARSNSLKTLSDANANRARKSALAATTERDRTRTALQAMTSGVASNWLGGQRELTAEQKSFLENTVAYYQEFAAGNTDDPEDRFWVAQAEHRLAQLFSRLGDFNESMLSADRAINLLEQIPSEWEPALVAMELAETLHDKEGSLVRLGRAGEALPIAQRANEVAKELVAVDPDDIQVRILLSKTTGNLGSRWQQLGKLDKSLTLKTESVLVLERLLLDQPDNLEIKRSLGVNSMNLGSLFARMRKLTESRVWLERSMQLRTELVDAEPDSAVFQFDLSYVLVNLAGLAYRRGDGNEAQALSERATKIARDLVGLYPIEERYRRHLNASLTNLSAIYNSNRKFDDSRDALDEAIAISERSIRDFPDVPMYRLQLANGKSKLATALSEQGRHQESIPHHDAAIAQLREMVEQSIENDKATRMLESALYGRATTLGYVDRHDDAIADWDALMKVTHPDERQTVKLCRATSLVKKGEIDSALADVERVLTETLALPKDQQPFNVFYNSACVHSLVSARVDESQSRAHALRAIELLQQAIDAGLAPIANVRADPELEPLHSYPEYQAIVKE